MKVMMSSQDDDSDNDNINDHEEEEVDKEEDDNKEEIEEPTGKHYDDDGDLSWVQSMNMLMSKRSSSYLMRMMTMIRRV